MATKRLRSIKGRACRFTRLDICGAPVFAAKSVVVTHGFITVTISEELENGDEYTQKNAWGEFEVNEKDPDLLKWVPVSIELSGVDPDVMDIVGGATPVIVGGNTIGFTRGPSAPSGGFAIEVWTKKAGADACDAEGTPEWGYFLVPFVRNGRPDGDIVIANAVLNVTLAGEGYSATADWDEGPHGDNPFLTTFPVGEMYGGVVTTVQPPDPTNGAAALVEPAP